MGFNRNVKSDFWINGIIVDQFQPAEKYFMLYLLTNPHTRQAGIYKLNKRVAAFELGYEVTVVSELLDRFQKKYKRIRYSSETQEVAVIDYLRYSVIKGGKPVQDCIQKDLEDVTDKRLIQYMLEQNKDYLLKSEKPSLRQIGELFQLYCSSLPPIPPNSFVFDNDVDIDIDIDSIVGVSSTIRTTTRKQPAKSKVDLPELLSSLGASLREAMEDFIEHRKNIKAPMSARAIKLLLTELGKLTDDDEVKVAVLNQSIINGWKGVFALRDANTVLNNKGRKISDAERILTL